MFQSTSGFCEQNPVPVTVRVVAPLPTGIEDGFSPVTVGSEKIVTADCPLDDPPGFSTVTVADPGCAISDAGAVAVN